MSAPLSDPSVNEGALPETDGSIAGRETAGKSQNQIVLGKFLRHKGAMISLVLLLVVIIFSFSAVGIGPIPGWWKFNFYNSSDVVNGGAPTWTLAHPFSLGDHPFGQDDIGRDNFARVLKGVQVSILMMLIMGVTLLVIGVIVGALAGYYRGWVDNALMRVTDGFIMLPTVVVGAILGVLAGHLASPPLLALVLGAILWPTLARLVRGEFLSLREREFVDSARVAGASDSRIMFKHMLPNSMGVVIVNTTLMMSQAIVLETALSFLGFGVHPPDVSLGQLINEYQGSFSTRPWLFWWPGLFIIIIALAVNFIGDGLRDAYDPRQRKIPSARKMAKADRLLAGTRNLAGPFTPGAPQSQTERRRGRDTAEDPDASGPDANEKE